MEAFKTTNIEEEVIEEVEVNEEECVQKEGFGSKAKVWFAKHGKKVATVAGLITIGAIGYVLGKNSIGDGEFLIDEDVLEDALEITEDAVSIETE